MRARGAEGARRGGGSPKFRQKRRVGARGGAWRAVPSRVCGAGGAGQRPQPAGFARPWGRAAGGRGRGGCGRVGGKKGGEGGVGRGALRDCGGDAWESPPRGPMSSANMASPALLAPRRAEPGSGEQKVVVGGVSGVPPLPRKVPAAGSGRGVAGPAGGKSCRAVVPGPAGVSSPGAGIPSACQ